jgi:hypothetical protein
VLTPRYMGRTVAAADVAIVSIAVWSAGKSLAIHAS